MSKVFFWNLRSNRKAPPELKLRRLLKACKLGAYIHSQDLVAVKIHFGEQGCTGFINPLRLNPILDFVRKCGGKPFLTDTNTLYSGQRNEAVSHAKLAARHGFDPNILQAPVIIADGLKSTHEVVLSVKSRHFQNCYLAGDIVAADFLLNISHFKGHSLTGFGGSLKNLGMGCATRKGKMQQHCDLGPKLIPELCRGCAQCIKQCSPQALFLDDTGKIALNRAHCTGCAACLAICRTGALSVNWQTDLKAFQEKMVEYAATVIENKENSALHINFVLNVTPECDCSAYSDRPICPDIGILASFDPVALDQSSLDLVNQAPLWATERLKRQYLPGENKFQALFSHINVDYQLQYAAEQGLGSRKYELHKI